LTSGKVQVHPLSVRKGGLEKVSEGLVLLREEKVSVEKLAYKNARVPQ